MVIALATLIIICYMINSLLGLGFALMSCYAIYKLYISKSNSLTYRLFELMIMALPMAYIGIGGMDMHQLFSWYNIFLIFFIINLLRIFDLEFPLSRGSYFSLFFILVCFCLNMFWTTDVFHSFVEVAQVFIMLVPIVIIHSSRHNSFITNDEAYQLIYRYTNICVATAIAMLVQFCFYFFAHQEIGIVHFTGGGRVAYFALFRGASILPIYMGIGIIFLFIECLDKQIKFERLAKIGFIFGAVVLNTSRTALFMIMFVLAMVCMKYLVKRFSIKGVFMTVLGFVLIYLGIDYILTLRSGLSSFVDPAGRMLTYENGMRIWLVNFKNFLLGEGFYADRWIGITKPHNVIIQTLAQNGFIVATIVFFMIVNYLWDNRNNPYIFLVLFVIATGMLVTDFYANAFTTVIFMLVDLYCSSKHKDKLAYEVENEIGGKMVI